MTLPNPVTTNTEGSEPVVQTTEPTPVVGNVPIDGAGGGDAVNDPQPPGEFVEAAKYQEAQKRLEETENNMRRLQATLDRNFSEQQKQWEDEKRRLEAQVHQANTQALPDEQKVLYQLKVERQQREQLQQQLEAERNRVNDIQYQQNYLSALAEMGIDTSKLDKTDMDTLLTTGWAAVAQELQTLRKGQTNGSPTEPGVQVNTPQPAQGPSVLTPTAGGQGGPTTNIQAALQAAARDIGKDNLTLDEFLSLGERRQIDINKYFKAT